MLIAKNSLTFVLGGFVLLMISVSTTADVYKWVDKDGKIHYSDQPPLSGDAKKMKRNSTDQSAPTPTQSDVKTKLPASVADQELEFRKRKAEKEEAEKKLQAAAEAKLKNKDYCNSLKGELLSHNDGTRLFRYNDKGERIYLDEKEHSNSKRDVESRIAKECQ